jgi:hypothetical protein
MAILPARAERGAAACASRECAVGVLMLLYGVDLILLLSAV